MKLVKKVNGYKIFELEKEECKKSFLVYPSFMAVPYWDENYDIDFAEDIEEKLEDVIKWTEKYPLKD